MDDTNFVDRVGDYLYVDGVYESDEEAHGDGSNTPSDKYYGYMMKEERPKQDDIENASHDKYIGAKVMINVPGEGTRRITFRCRVEYLDGTKVGTYHWNPLMDTHYYEPEYDDGTHD